MENNKIISIVTDTEYHNTKHNCEEITCEPGVFYVDRFTDKEEDNIYVLARDVWVVTWNDEGKVMVDLAQNYADAKGPYKWSEELPWTKSN